MSKHRKLLTLSATFGVASLAIHAANKFISINATINHISNRSNKMFYNWRFGKIAYSKAGSGSPILLIHDTMPGASSFEWSKVAKTLSQNHTIYSLDLLGCGLSEKPGITYTSFLYVQLISDFIANVIGTKTDIVASRFSSSFSIMSCVNNKDIIGKVILINPPLTSSLKKAPTKRDLALRTFLQIPIFGTLIYHMIVSKENISELFMDKLYNNPFIVDKAVLNTYYESSHSGGFYSKYLYACYVSKYLNINIEPALSSIDNPIYIVTGNDPKNILIAEEYSKWNPSINIYPISKTKLVPHLEQPEAFVNAILQIYLS